MLYCNGFKVCFPVACISFAILIINNFILHDRDCTINGHTLMVTAHSLSLPTLCTFQIHHYLNAFFLSFVNIFLNEKRTNLSTENTHSKFWHLIHFRWWSKSSNLPPPWHCKCDYWIYFATMLCNTYCQAGHCITVHLSKLRHICLDIGC